MNLILIFRLSLVLFLLINFTSSTQTFYRSVADVDSFTYVTMNDKILILKRDQSNELQYVNSIPFIMNHRSDNFNSAIVLNDYLLVSSLDSVVLFSILDRENPTEFSRIEVQNVLRLNKFGPYSIIYTPNYKIVIAIQDSIIITMTTFPHSIYVYNPFVLPNNFSQEYPLIYYNSAYSIVIKKFDDNQNAFIKVDSILSPQNFQIYGLLTNTTTAYVMEYYWDSFFQCERQDWFRYDRAEETLINRSFLCNWLCDNTAPSPFEGFSMNNNNILNLEGAQIFAAGNPCEPLLPNISSSVLDYPFILDSLIYRIGSQGLYYLYQQNGNNLTFHKFLLPVSVDNEINSIPTEMELEQNYPNPFNPETKIKYSLHKSSQVKLNVYDILGIRVSTVVNEYKNSGTYETTFDGSDLPSGMYFYNLVSENNSITKKMMLIK